MGNILKHPEKKLGFQQNLTTALSKLNIVISNIPSTPNFNFKKDKRLVDTIHENWSTLRSNIKKLKYRIKEE